MRLVIDYRLAAYSTRGMARYCREMTKELVKILPKEWDVLLYIDKKSKKEFVPSNIKHRLLPTGNFIIGEQLFLPYFLRKDKANILWSPYNTFPLWKRRGIKYYATIHDLIFFEKTKERQSFKQKVGKYYRRFVISKGVNILNGIFTVSEFSKKAIFRRFGISNVVVTPNCIGSFVELVNKRQLKQHYKRTDFYFTVSGDAPSKNFNFLYQWFKEHPNYKLEVAGFPPSSFFRNNCPENITILPPNVSDEILIEKYCTCKAFVFVSKQEGFGIPVLEAMACGCKLILSDSTSIPEIAGDNAIYVNPEKTDELEEAIMIVVNYEVNTHEMMLQLNKYTDWKKSAQELMESVIR